MNQTVTLPVAAVQLPAPTQGKWQREHEAFRRLLPQLLTTHQGQYEAVHNGQVVDSGNDKLALALRVLAKVGNVAIHGGLVTGDAPPIERSGVRREVLSGGGAA